MPPARAEVPSTAEPVPEPTALDALTTEVMSTWQIPGGWRATALEDRLVFNRGFGYGSNEDDVRVDPWDRIRVASTSQARLATNTMWAGTDLFGEQG